MQGYVQVYTGNGKGKTTAALGLALRAAGAGLRVYIIQFLKLGDYSEIKALLRFADLITVEQYGAGRFIKGRPSPQDIDMAQKGLARARQVMSELDKGLVILEEANVAVTCGLFTVGDLTALMDSRPPAIELVITGRNAAPQVIEKADLVTEMREIKHYYHHGVAARIGIEK